MTEVKKYILLLILFTVLPTYWFWGYFKEVFDIIIFYKGIAITFFLMAVYITIANNSNRLLTTIILFSTTNNLLDELFFNPYKFELNEKISVGFLLIYITLFFYGKRTSKNFASKIHNYIVGNSIAKSDNKQKE